jgi:hypothetical protein
VPFGSKLAFFVPSLFILAQLFAVGSGGILFLPGVLLEAIAPLSVSRLNCSGRRRDFSLRVLHVSWVVAMHAAIITARAHVFMGLR